MTTLKEIREELAQTLTDAGFNTFDHIPATFTAPAAVIEDGEPYIRFNEGKPGATAYYSVILMTAKGTNAKQTEDLDGFLHTAIAALRADNWHASAVDQPGMYGPDKTFLGAKVTVNSGTVPDLF